MKVFAIAAGMICLTVMANILMKKGTTDANTQQLFFRALFNWKIAASFTCFAAGALLYAILLRWLPLNVAQCFAAAQFIGVIVASMLILSEPISIGQWTGIALIALGIVVVGLTSPTG